MPDFGEILFRDLLKVSQYPGSPFTGDIITDIVLYFFIPTVLLILVVFVLLGRLAVQQRGIRVLLGIAIYLFVVFSGYFAVFVMLGNAYFLFLVFILGLIYFIPTHFRIRTHGYPHTGERARSSRYSPYTDNELDKEAGEVAESLDKLVEKGMDHLAVEVFREQALPIKDEYITRHRTLDKRLQRAIEKATRL